MNTIPHRDGDPRDNDLSNLVTRRTVMSLDEAHMATLAELRADIIRSAAAGQGPTFIAAKLDILIAKAVAPECRCDCVNCVTGNHSGCYYKPSVCPMKFSKRDVQP
jgi:hypothetical protein